MKTSFSDKIIFKMDFAQSSDEVPLDPRPRPETTASSEKSEEMMPDTVIHNDSGHESSGSVSTPELPTPEEKSSSQTILLTSLKESDKIARESSDSKFYRIKIHIPTGENIDVQVEDTYKNILQYTISRLVNRTLFKSFIKCYWREIQPALELATDFISRAIRWTNLLKCAIFQI